MRGAPRYPGPFARDEGAPDSFWISLRYFNLYRMVVAGLFLGLTIFTGDALNLGAHRLDLFRAASAVYLALAGICHSVLRHLRAQFNVQLSMHVFLDIVAITVLMYASGGVRSGLGAMLLISLIGAALVAPRRLALAYAALAAIALLLEQSYWVLRFDAPEANYLQPGLLAIGCFASAGVTSWLAQRVAASEHLARRRGRELELQMRVNQLVIKDMQDGVLVLDAGGRVLQHNPSAQRLLGADELRGAELAALAPEAAQRWREWRAGGRPAQAGIPLRGRDLRLRLMEAGADEDLSVVFVEDTSRAVEEARQLKLAALGRLTANIAHEIRNPLSAISHAVELLGEEGGAEGRERLYRIIRDNAGRLDRLVADVLQLNRRDRAAAERIELAGWLAQFVEDFTVNEAVPRERISVEAVRAVHVQFDREHLRQVLWNLARNAVRHARPALGCVRIIVAAFGGQAEINVIDNGPGVPRGHQGQLFEPFYTTDSKGTGLGLYLARELCAANGAELEYVGDMPGAHFRILCREAAP
jgi:two-component system sensor histidine kinase PilS (NtrC family)